MQTAYESWFGQPVVLQLMAGELKVPVKGTILSETEKALKFRIGEGWDIEIFKSMILGIQQDDWMSAVT